MAAKVKYEGYRIINSSKYEFQACFLEYISQNDTPWHIHNPFIRHLPVLATQLGIAIFVMRLLTIILKPLHQPRFVAEIIATILIGPSGLAQIPDTNFGPFKWTTPFPFENTTVLETLANLGVTYYMFLVGLEMDLSTLKSTGKKSWSIALAGILIPFITGAGLYFVPIFKDPNLAGSPMGAVFWAITLSITSFPDLARTLSDVKLLHTELGRVALTSAIITDISTWIFLAAAITIFGDTTKFVTVAMLPIIFFAVFCLVVLRPGIVLMTNFVKNKQGKFSDRHIYFILIGVVVSGFITDACGSHSLVGGFIFGLVFPKGELAMEIMERTEEFVNGIMLPCFIISSGLRTNMYYLQYTKWPLMALITTIATSAKIISTVLVTSIFGMSLKDGLTLGGLMNTKGVFSLIVVNEGRSLQNLDIIHMVVMVFISLCTACLVEPMVLLVDRTRKHSRQNELTIEGINPDSEFRIMTCFHSVQNLSGIIRLLEASSATEKSPMCFFAVQLVELTERASAMLIVHDKLKTEIQGSPSRENAHSDHIFSAFENYKIGNEEASISMHLLSVLSPYASMHKDIFKLAKDKAAQLILIPFHKQPSADGGLQGVNHSVKEVNKNLLVKAPCSVGILVDRGLGSSKSLNSVCNGRSLELRFAMFFIGGPDDHEALSYAWRMAGKKGVTLTVVRFRLGKDAEVAIVPENKDNEDEIFVAIKELGDPESTTGYDDAFINEFRFKSMCNESITFLEKPVNNSEELEKAIGELYNNFDLYIVGRGLEVKSPLTKGLIDGIDNPELGPIADTLVSSRSTAHASVVVVQRSTSGGLNASLRHSKGKFTEKKWASPILNPDYEAITKDKKKDY